MANFPSYDNMTVLMTAIGNKFAELSGAYIIKGNSSFANLPATPTIAQMGFAYNVTDEFTTDSRFVDGAGKTYPAGTNVVIVNTGSSSTPSMKYDVMGAFVDVGAIEDSIQEVSDTIGATFDSASAYSVGNYVIKDGVIYKFKAAHTAGQSWNSSEVDTIGSVIDLVLGTSGGADSRVDTVVSDLAPAFSASHSGGYAIGDVVTYGDKLYKFKAAHTQGSAWNVAEVDEITVTDLEPQPLTAAQINALVALL